MDRRGFIVSTLGLGLAAHPALGAPEPPECEIGRAVLRAGVVARDPAALRAGLGLGPSSRARLTKAWDPIIRADFSSGRTVHVEGWLLSVTEAQICALAALAPRAAGRIAAW
ncbi:hypothetical protein OCH239_13020 [Roseivivax halodurans JCM 10272]|uniref:Uncharacterized protein n=1 Tax=Roseivivax halodurans JCM 10272 TaxID=1449350 RepID=X7EDA4_9RHOB|nr:hypothetical protein [Roseivivax halodurans]ETX13186.1 hypothetical protein OCH239_13020 [Roseivivax halodurans JCM 10272]